MDEVQWDSDNSKCEEIQSCDASNHARSSARLVLGIILK